MLIEIKNLPEGRKVKHIKVDVTFEEDEPVVSTQVDEICPTIMPLTETPPQEDSTSVREKKDILTKC